MLPQVDGDADFDGAFGGVQGTDIPLLLGQGATPRSDLPCAFFQRLHEFFELFAQVGSRVGTARGGLQVSYIVHVLLACSLRQRAIPHLRKFGIDGRPLSVGRELEGSTLVLGGRAFHLLFNHCVRYHFLLFFCYSFFCVSRFRVFAFSRF